MITVACVLSDGPTYNYSHVERLSRMVHHHMKQDYRFVCLNDSPYPGWWAKISLFEPGRFKGRVLYLDLDVTVIDDLDEIANYPDRETPFVAIDDWLRPTINSSVMAWDAGTVDHIYEKFAPGVMERLAGDQDWITEQMPDAEALPPSWCVSYRKHVRMFKTVPPGAKVVVYHGQPKPWDVE